MAIRLTVLATGRTEPTALDFDQERVRIGRGGMCDVRLPDPSVSAVHAMVLLDRDRYFVVDLGSTNGTRLGGEPLVENRRKLLRSGDVIAIGGFEVEFHAGVAMLSPHCQDRTAAAARHLARQVMSSARLELRPPALVVLGGPQQGERFTLPPAPATVVVGRGADCDLVLVDGEASRRHAAVEVTAEGVVVRDLGGKNGLRVGGREVEKARLRDRDEVEVGGTVLVLDEPVEAFLRQMAELAEDEPASPSEPEADPGESRAGPEPVGSSVEVAIDERLEADDADDEVRARSPAEQEGEESPPSWDDEAPRRAAAPDAGTSRRAAGTELAVLLVGAIALAVCVAALVWLFR